MHRCSPDHTQVPECTGDRYAGIPKSSPIGMYAQHNVKLDLGVTIELIAVTFPPPDPAHFDGPQSYGLDLKGCVITSTDPFYCMQIHPPGLHMTIPNGVWVPPSVTPNDSGVMFLPGGDKNKPIPGGIGTILKIHWCPTQDYFVVVLNGQMLDPLLPVKSVFATVSA